MHQRFLCSRNDNQNNDVKTRLFSKRLFLNRMLRIKKNINRTRSLAYAAHCLRRLPEKGSCEWALAQSAKTSRRDNKLALRLVRLSPLTKLNFIRIHIRNNLLKVRFNLYKSNKFYENSVKQKTFKHMGSNKFMNRNDLKVQSFI